MIGIIVVTSLFSIMIIYALSVLIRFAIKLKTDKSNSLLALAILCILFPTSIYPIAVFTHYNRTNNKEIEEKIDKLEEIRFLLNHIDSLSKKLIFNETASLEDSVFNYIIDVKLAHPHIVYAQALLESSHFKSNIFIENNNMFGMKKAYSRPNFQEKEENRGHATYLNWQRCIDDYVILQVYSYKDLKQEDYLKKLQKRYAESEKYSETLLKMIRTPLE